MEDEVARMQNEIDDLKERIEQMEDLMQDVIPGGDWKNLEKVFHL